LVRESARLGTTQPSFEIASETLNRLGRVGISDTTVWRHHQEVTGRIEAELERQESAGRVFWGNGEERLKVHEAIEGHCSVSIDGAMVLIRGEGYREVKIVSVSEVVVEESADGGKQGGGREASGSGTGQEKRGRQDGLKLVHHSYRAVLGDKATFEPALKGELARRRVEQAVKVSTVNDGAEWIWDLVQKHLPEKRVEILDWPHALENLAKAAHAAWGEDSQEAQDWLEERASELWNGERMGLEIALYKLPRRYKERGKAIRQVKEYFDKHWARIEYDRFRAEGRPIGSGTVESAAKNVVQWRMKRGGQRWSRSGATRMLAALGEVHSTRWQTIPQCLAKAA